MLPSDVRAPIKRYLASIGEAFTDRPVVVGQSGNFTIETVLSALTRPASVHSNDLAFWACMAGRALTGREVEYEIIDERLAWITPLLTDPWRRLAAIPLLGDLRPWLDHDNEHALRMVAGYRHQFAGLLDATVTRLMTPTIKVSTFTERPVLDHFQQFTDPGTVFVCAAPGVNESARSAYSAADALVDWDEPDFDPFDRHEADDVLDWLRSSGRYFFWIDDRPDLDLPCVLREVAGNTRVISAYSNLARHTVLYNGLTPPGAEELPLADGDLEITKRSVLTVRPIAPRLLSKYKDTFLGKNIKHSAGKWAFAVVIDGKVIGFFEFDTGQPMRQEPPGFLYLHADFPISTTRYARLSKLISMLAVAGETWTLMERIVERRLKVMVTTAFTEHAVSMKYRGVMTLVKRGEKPDGSHFLNYMATRQSTTWRQTLRAWLQKQGGELRGQGEELTDTEA